MPSQETQMGRGNFQQLVIPLIWVGFACIHQNAPSTPESFLPLDFILSYSQTFICPLESGEALQRRCKQLETEKMWGCSNTRSGVCWLLSDTWKLNSVPASVHLKVTLSKSWVFPSFRDCWGSPIVLESLLPASSMQHEHWTGSQRCQQSHQGQKVQIKHHE